MACTCILFLTLDRTVDPSLPIVHQRTVALYVRLTAKMLLPWPACHIPSKPRGRVRPRRVVAACRPDPAEKEEQEDYFYFVAVVLLLKVLRETFPVDEA